MSHLESGLARIRTQGARQVPMGSTGSCWTGQVYPGLLLTPPKTSIQTLSLSTHLGRGMRISGWMVIASERGDRWEGTTPGWGRSFRGLGSDWQGSDGWGPADAKGRASRPRHVWQILQLWAHLLLWEASDRCMQGSGTGLRASPVAATPPILHPGWPHTVRG